MPVSVLRPDEHAPDCCWFMRLRLGWGGAPASWGAGPHSRVCWALQRGQLCPRHFPTSPRGYRGTPGTFLGGWLWPERESSPGSACHASARSPRQTSRFPTELWGHVVQSEARTLGSSRRPMDSRAGGVQEEEEVIGSTGTAAGRWASSWRRRPSCSVGGKEEGLLGEGGLWGDGKGEGVPPRGVCFPL